jgi:hypothetical protein
MQCFRLRRPVDALRVISRSKEHPEVRAEAPVCVLHGTDSLHAIGLPDGKPITDVSAAQDTWQAELKSLFPVAVTGAVAVPDLSKFQADPGTLAPCPALLPKPFFDARDRMLMCWFLLCLLIVPVVSKFCLNERLPIMHALLCRH